MNKKATEALKDFSIACYNADCNKGLTGYNTSMIETVSNEVEAKSEKEALEIIDNYYKNIQE